MESKTIDEQRKDVRVISIHDSAKPVCVRKTSKKDMEEINPLLAKEVPRVVIKSWFSIVFSECRDCGSSRLIFFRLHRRTERNLYWDVMQTRLTLFVRTRYLGSDDSSVVTHIILKISECIETLSCIAVLLWICASIGWERAVVPISIQTAWSH